MRRYKDRFLAYSTITIYNSIVGIFLGLCFGVTLAHSCSDEALEKDLPKCENVTRIGEIRQISCPRGTAGVTKQICAISTPDKAGWFTYLSDCIPQPCNTVGELRELSCDGGKISQECTTLPEGIRWVETANTCSPAPSTSLTVTWQNHIAPLFDQHCSTCHNSQTPNILSYDTAKSVIDAILSHIEPGSEKQMPPSGPIAPEERDLILKWKEHGLLESPVNTDKPDGGCQTPGSEQDSNESGEVKPIYQPTGKEVNLKYGARHPNGDRYNALHHFRDYEVTGHFQVANAEKILISLDGPKHANCTEIPRCMWAEPSFLIATGTAELGAEYPHPTQRDDITCQSCTILIGTYTNTWIGYKVIAYTNKDGFRTYEQWIDISLSNDWKLTLREVDYGQIVANSPTRSLPLDGTGLEAEIRLHGGHNTAMKYGKIVEIIPPT